MCGTPLLPGRLAGIMHGMNTCPAGARWCAIILIACLPLSACAASPPDADAEDASCTFPSGLAARLQTEIDGWAESPPHRGVSASVILSSGRQWVGAAGHSAADERMTPEHLIWIASITKTMTGAVVMRLAENGSVELDDPVSKWLDPIRHVDPRITIRQLLNHTSGLANYSTDRDLDAVVRSDGTRVFPADTLIGYVGPPVFERGGRTQYTNTAFVLLGMIAVKATGRPITDLWAEMLWGPLGLSEIFLPGFQDPPGPVADAWYGPEAGNLVAPLDRMSLLTLGNAAFGLFSNARTVARWGRGLFHGDALGDTMRVEMLTFVPAAGNIPGESGAGLGIRRYAYLGRAQWGHSGGSPLGSSLLLYDERTGITVAVLMNQGRDAGHFRLAPRLLEIAAGR